MVSPAVAERYAANLRRLRAEAGLSQEGLAFRAGIHRTAVSLMENGKRLPGFETMVRLVGALGIEAGALLDGIAWEPTDLNPGKLVLTSAGDDASGAAEDDGGAVP